MLNVTMAIDHGRYLGLPLLIGKSKKLINSNGTSWNIKLIHDLSAPCDVQ